jgi:hypothetical protein
MSVANLQYPQTLALRHACRKENVNKRSAPPAARQPITRGGITVIPPSERLVRLGHSKHCADCVRFVKMGGACPGGVADGVPACKEHQNGMLESPVRMDEHGHLSLLPGQERFWRCSDVMTAREALGN